MTACCDKLTDKVCSLYSNPATFAKQPDCFHPTKGFFYAFTDALACFIGFTACCPFVQTRGLLTFLLCNVWNRSFISAVLYKLFGMIAFITSNRLGIETVLSDLIQLTIGYLSFSTVFAAGRTAKCTNNPLRFSITE